MTSQAVLAGALASVFMTCVASAEVRIVNDTGGEILSYVRKFQHIAASGERVVIDGPCLSACTLLTGVVPSDRICVTRRAALGFHAASYYDDASRTFVPTQHGSRIVMQLYPPRIRAWIMQQGGLTPRLLILRGRELAALYPPCQ